VTTFKKRQEKEEEYAKKMKDKYGRNLKGKWREKNKGKDMNNWTM
jgi:hypothetical protein